MSGHSKWSTIKRQKGANDAKRGALFTKLARDIVLAVRDGGGGDPDMNFRLRLAVDKAKSNNMPLDSITRAIRRATGQGEGVEDFAEVTYEGYGPGRQRHPPPGVDHQPKPHRLRGPVRLQPGRRQPWRGRLRILELRDQGRHYPRSR